MEEKTCDALRTELEQAQKQIAYFKRLAKNAGDLRVRETEELSRLIAKLRQTEKALHESEAKYRSLFENAIEGIFQTTPDGQFLTANPALARLFGYDSAQEFMAKITDIGRQHYAHPEDRATYRDILEREGVVKGFEVQLLAKDGSATWVSISARVVRDTDGAAVCYEGAIEDITARKQAEENLRYLTIHDPLTGLHNRFLFEEELRRFDTGRYDPVGIVMCDLDGLKLVNDNLGHDIGDRQLITTAGLLKASCRTNDIVARIGGDEFGILLPDCPANITTRVCDRLKQAMVNLYIPGTSIPLIISIGYATGRAQEHPIKELLKEADVNMYIEKRLNRARFGKCFDEIMSRASLNNLQGP